MDRGGLPNDDNLAEIAEGTSIRVVVDMWAPGWRGRCRMVSPGAGGRVGPPEMAGADSSWLKVNVDAPESCRQRFQTWMAIPTLMVRGKGRWRGNSRARRVPAASLRNLGRGKVLGN